MALGVLAVIVACERFAPRVPGSLLAVALAILVTWLFKLDQHGIATVGRVQAGLPVFGLPRVSWAQTEGLLATSASMFLVIVAQSAATSRSFAQKHREDLNENRDLLALGAANLLAGFSNTFVVNGSPTKTAVVEAAGGRTQAAQVTTAVMTLAVLLFATALIERLPNAALAAIVFLIGVKLIDVRSLRQIASFPQRDVRGGDGRAAGRRVPRRRTGHLHRHRPVGDRPSAPGIPPQGCGAAPDGHHWKAHGARWAWKPSRVDRLPLRGARFSSPTRTILPRGCTAWSSRPPIRCAGWCSIS